MIVGRLGTDAYIAVEGIVNGILLGVILISLSLLHSRQLSRHLLTHRCCRTDLTSNIVTAIYLIDKDIVGFSSKVSRQVTLTIDVYKGITAHISHTGTAKHLTLRIFQRTLSIRIKYCTYITGLYSHLRAALHLRMVTATIYVTTNLNLPLRYNRAQESNNQYGDNSSHLSFNFQFSARLCRLARPRTFLFPHSTFTVGLSKSGSDITYRYVGLIVRSMVYLHPRFASVCPENILRLSVFVAVQPWRTRLPFLS